MILYLKEKKDAKRCVFFHFPLSKHPVSLGISSSNDGV
jgi:hypothetical protein